MIEKNIRYPKRTFPLHLRLNKTKISSSFNLFQFTTHHSRAVLNLSSVVFISGEFSSFQPSPEPQKLYEASLFNFHSSFQFMMDEDSHFFFNKFDNEWQQRENLLCMPVLLCSTINFLSSTVFVYKFPNFIVRPFCRLSLLYDAFFSPAMMNFHSFLVDSQSYIFIRLFVSYHIANVCICILSRYMKCKLYL